MKVVLPFLIVSFSVFSMALEKEDRNAEPLTGETRFVSSSGEGVVDTAGVPQSSGEGVVDTAGVPQSSGEGVVDTAGVPQSSGEGVVDTAGVPQSSGEGVVDTAGVPQSSGEGVDMAGTQSSGEGVDMAGTQSSGEDVSMTEEAESVSPSGMENQEISDSLSGQTGPDQDEGISSKSVVQVYKYDSDREDCSKPAIEPWDMQVVLEEHNVTVLSSGKGYDGLMNSVEDWGCRVYPPRINIFSIPEGDTHSLSVAKELGFDLCEDLKVRGGSCYPVSYSELVSGNENKFVVPIYKYSNGKQCQPGSEIDIDFMEQELAGAKVVVYQRYRAVDGVFYPFKCGHETGSLNVFVVEKSSLTDVVSMGYRECAWLEMRGGGCYRLSE